MSPVPPIEARDATLALTHRVRGARAEVAAVIVSSLVVHVAVAITLGGGHAYAERLVREPTRIAIAVRRPAAVPPPPAPPPEPPRVPPPSRPNRPHTEQSRPPVPQPVQAAVPVAETPVVAAPAIPTDVVPAAPASSQGEIAVPVANVAATPPAAAPPRRVEPREGANYQHNPRPAYPRIAQREGWEGTVALRVQVGANGRPIVVRLARSSGRDALDEAAIAAVRGWTFTPASVDGVPTSGWVNVPIVFRLGR